MSNVCTKSSASCSFNECSVPSWMLMYRVVGHREESFSNGPSNVIGEPVRLTTTGDIAKLYGRA